ncbi:phosphonate ABC transporter, permease protein PhnE [Aliarcobacter cibarius]|jgi:phosphonate transport system permease protein|uniref:Phosphonate ABC transporter, permease protein PhnE n=1 Tax=Aliarcobacter cibarius TaxID=255507 RepID=A0ABY2V3D8_9BACT|nr:phosphonate ABC transporter, permease protein PhnE [Aliarcobacter cibarius]MDD2974822.1 phosphonate ABC transporter, permease protein PhnE [Aliarcobacter cryaerophilus]TLS97588.1 phosphonate ABC transporter, permease protein PhnE [Aliarcobacter cibarius]TLS98103.1 phosphonate ABC transporter, permease protein PhnE [Aliarcobacter cibarius]
MSVEKLKKESNPFKIFNLVIICIFIYIVTQSWIDTEMNFSVLINGWSYMSSYIQGNPEIEGSSYFPPNTNTRDLVTYFWAMLETVQMAIIALLLSVILAIPLSYITSRNILMILIPGKTIFHELVRKTLYGIGTFIANVFRSVNELVWALIFVSAVGLGPMAGILALGIHTAGVLSKLLSEGNEAIDPGPVEALTNSGAGFVKILAYAVVPQTMPHFISMVLYRFESDVRSASILGFVGAGGIGYYLFDKLRSFENADVCTILIFIVITVWGLDKISAMIRKRFI